MAKTILLTQQEGVRVSARCGDHEVIFDWNEERGGTNQGMSPGELLCASLGACTVMTIVRYCRTVGIPVADVTAEAAYESDEKGTRADRYKIRVSLPGGAPGREKAIPRAAKRCYVEKTLENPPEIEIKIEGPGFE